jgi:hypothetical protein
VQRLVEEVGWLSDERQGTSKASKGLWGKLFGAKDR